MIGGKFEKAHRDNENFQTLVCEICVHLKLTVQATFYIVMENFFKAPHKQAIINKIKNSLVYNSKNDICRGIKSKLYLFVVFTI